ncbi:hypothetical protein [Alteromonas mediterranea]|uniref:hypothetical protein n=1 Tax=Alteromonas mediterranea TaxID=314275 RepID=UPI000C4485F7|nr:hypothetical protein [Alteromonas mediterranea]MBB66875.1 hypothetical protein [Rickettsiales bacterium]
MDFFEAVGALLLVAFMGYFLNVFYVQGNNILLFMLNSFWWWLSFVVLLSFFFWKACYSFDMNVGYPFWASAFVAYKQRAQWNDKSEKQIANDVYMQMFNVGRGVLKVTSGRVAFIATSLFSWVYLYSEITSYI